MHLLGNVVASNVSGIRSNSLGAFHLKSSTGGFAKGMPTKEIVFEPSFSFATDPIKLVFLDLNL